MSPFKLWDFARVSVRTVPLFQSPLVEVRPITADSYFYGQSPAVYPSPLMPGSDSWAVSYSKATHLVSQMSLDEKADITVGHSPDTGCVGQTGSVTRLNFPGLCLADAGNGLRYTDLVNAWPSGLHVGASWNKELAYKRGLHMGGEFKTKGVHMALGPVVGPLGRVAEGGRNWEGFSNDPFLCGALAAGTVEGMQDAGVTASVKHYIGNEQETHRNPEGNAQSLSSNIDDKTMHEMYLWPFADTVHAGAGSIMCSYNRANNSYACQNSKLMNGLLKTELGFEGFVVSDWNAQYAGLASAEAGLDMAMPDSPYWGPGAINLVTAVHNGSLNESRITDMATRIVATWYQMGQDKDFPANGVGLARDYTQPHKVVNARKESSKPVLLDGAIEGHVLVKNVNNTLPLKKPEMLYVLGYDAPAPPRLNIGDPGDWFGRYMFGFESLLDYQLFQGIPAPQIAKYGTIISGGGSGANAPPYISAPFDALQEQAYKDNTALFWDFTSTNPTIDPAADACLVFINAFATETFDRLGLHDDYSDNLITNIANRCSNTIVVIHNAGPRLVDQWIDHPNIKAVIFGHLPGQDSGRAVVELLYGRASPSGKLPYTLAKNESDYTNGGKPTQPTNDQFALFPQDNFTEGVYIDYRDFDTKGITPRYEFGFGLTYTTFEFSSLSVKIIDGADTGYLPPKSRIIEGGLKSLWDVVAHVSVNLKNTGNMEAMEVVQLYVGIPGGPMKQLRGFEKVRVGVGQSVTVHFHLKRRDLSEWGVAEQSWVLPKGNYGVFVGSSSRDLPVNGTLSI